MNNQPAKELKDFIDSLSCQIHQLRKKIDICDSSNRLYNRLIIERACAREQLKKLQSKNVVSFLFKKFNTKNGQKLICDYFNNK